MKVAVIGASGLVGKKMLEVLIERNFPITELIPVASLKSYGKEILFKSQKYLLQSMEYAIAAKPKIALFSAGGNVSLKWAPLFAANEITVIDNSSAWRMDSDKKLIVPEVNSQLLTKQDKIIANPNCSTIQMVVVLHPLHKKYKIKRIVVSTYQSVTGTGVKALTQLYNERKNGSSEEMAYKYQIDLNVIPQIDVFLENGYTKEEMKMVHETRKILGDSSINITATTVRIPTIGGHSESINIEFENEFNLTDIFKILNNTPGLILQDDVKNQIYPMPILSEGKDAVFVGRIRRDESQPKTLNLWVVADNLRKGAATNAIQIAEHLIKNNLI